VNDILELRAYEDSLTRSYLELHSRPTGETYVALNQEFQRVQDKLESLELLLAEIDAVATADAPLVAALMPHTSHISACFQA